MLLFQRKHRETTYLVLCHILTLLKSRELDWTALLKSRGTQLGTIPYDVPPHSPYKIQTLFYISPTPRFHVSLFWHLYTLSATLNYEQILIFLWEREPRSKAQITLGRQRGSNETVWRQLGDKHAACASRAISQHAHNTYIPTLPGGQWLEHMISKKPEPNTFAVLNSQMCL